MRKKQSPAFKKRASGEGRSTGELFSEARAGLRELEKLMERRRNRDGASRMLTEIYTAVQEIAQRFAAIGPEFEARTPRIDDEEEQSREHEPLGMADLFPVAMSDEERDLDAQLCGLVDDYHLTYRTIELVRARHYRDFIDYVAVGCTQVRQVAANLLALSRRVRPESMKALGMGQSDVARKLGEERATTSAREKRKVERPLQANGTKGYLLHGTTKSATHRAKCREAQMGNTNRRDAHARRLAATTSGLSPNSTKAHPNPKDDRP